MTRIYFDERIAERFETYWPHLFEPAVSTKPGGGLGLHVVKGIVQHNGGSVHAANRVDGPGAEFTITLPAPVGMRPAHA